MNMLFRHFVFFFFLLTSVTFAQTPTWKNITPPGWSGSFQFVDWFAGNGLHAIANNGYFYKSVDTGKTWTPYSKPVASVTSITLYPDHKRAYICGGSHLYQTTDAAVSWQEIKYTGMPSNIAIFHIYIKTEDTLLASASDGVNGAKIYKSPNKGLTWTLVGTNLFGDNALGSSISGFYFANPSHGYALGDGFYVETTNGGTSWVVHKIDINTFFYGILEIQNHSTIISTNTQNPPSTTNAIYFKGGINKIVQAGKMVYGVYGVNFFSSSDSGKTWKIKSIDANKIFNSITFLDQQTGIVVGNYLTTYVTNDGGKTWTKYIHGAAEGFNKIYCKTKDECYITGKTGRLFHTIDGGNTWNYRDLNTSILAEIKFPTKDTGYISASGSLFRTIDGGNSWKQFIQNTSGGILCFPTKDTGYVGYTGAYIQKSTDGGETWNDTWQESGDGGLTFRSASEGLMSGINNLLYTKDGGDTWKAKATGVYANEITPTTDKGWVILSIFDSTVNSLQQQFVQMYKCDKDVNCKKTITTTASGGGLKSINDSTLCFQSGDSIYYSRNYGNSWKSQLYWAGAYDLCFPTSQIAFSIGKNSIYKAYFASNLTINNIKVVNKTVSMSLTTISEAISIPATLYLLDNNGDTVYSLTKVIDNSSSLSITLPETITDGTYSIEIIPNDTLLYNKTHSQTFTISSTKVNMVDVEKNIIVKVIGNTIICNSQIPFEIYNTLGQRMQNNAELPVGVYVIRCNNVVQKVIIKP